MEKTVRKISWKNILSGLVLLAIVIAIFIPLEGMTSASDNYEVEMIDDGWDGTTTADKATYENITISKTKFPMQNKGDLLSLYRNLPDSHIKNPVICLYSIHAKMQVYLDGELIYDYGNATPNEERLTGYGMHVIQLPSDYAGKFIQVYYSVQEDGAFEGLQAPRIMNATYRTQNLMAENRINLIVTLLLVIVGGLAMIIASFMSFQNRTFIRIFWVALFSFAIGLWSMCNNECLSIFILNVSRKSYVEYSAFFLMALPFLLYFENRIHAKGFATWLKIYYWTITVGQIAFYVIANILHFTDVCHFPNFVFVEHIFLVLSILFFLMLMAEEKRLYHEVDWHIAIGFGFATALAFAEMIRYNVRKYIIGFDENTYKSTLIFSVFIIVATLFLDFSRKIYGALRRDTRNRLLQDMAYLDELTGLHNRRYCAEHIKQLANESGTKFAIVNMDMNLLKALNDTFGHETGDKALKSFAEVLEMVYPKDAIIARMGGDEFAVVLLNCDETQTKNYVQNMLDEMERRNHQEEIITLSTAYGCAYSYECDSPEAVYKLADQRMYACKKEMHMSRD